MNGTLQSIREKTNQYIFTGQAYFEPHEIDAIGKAILSGDIIEELEDNLSFIQANIGEIQTDVKGALRKVQAALKLLEVNDLPEEFTNSFRYALDHAVDYLETAEEQADCAEESSKEMAESLGELEA